MPSLELTPDLTGQVTKIDPWSFAWGGSADIYKGRYEGRTVAVKVMKSFPDSEAFNRRLRREVTVWSGVNHPNILPLLGICSDFDRPNTPSLVSPYCSNGNITNYLKCRPGVDRLQLLIHIASALSYLHSVSIIHGDVKASNILINDNGEASLSDYGLSRIFEMSGFTTKPRSATWRYAPPDLFSEDNFYPVTTTGWRWIACELMAYRSDEGGENTQRTTIATDVWSFAMTVIEILTESIPFSHIKSDARVILSVTAGDRPKRELCPQVSDNIWEMLVRCWDSDPTQRPSMASLCQFLALQVT